MKSNKISQRIEKENRVPTKTKAVILYWKEQRKLLPVKGLKHRSSRILTSFLTGWLVCSMSHEHKMKRYQKRCGGRKTWAAKQENGLLCDQQEKLAHNLRNRCLKAFLSVVVESHRCHRCCYCYCVPQESDRCPTNKRQLGNSSRNRFMNPKRQVSWKASEWSMVLQ